MKEFEYRNKVMGCDLYISIITDNDAELDDTFNACYLELKEYESRFSRFDENSELSILNNKRELNVSDIFWEAFEVAEKLFKETNGIFNPLTQIAQFGYTADFSQRDHFVKKETVNYNDDFSKIVIDREKKYIKLGTNQKLDFGGFLKGYLAQKVSEKIKDFHGTIINIGGDIYAQGLDENNEKFTFSIFNPITRQDILEIPLHNKTISTSGTYKRNWKIGDETFSHIVNPVTKETADQKLISASIITDDGGLSEAFATTSIILGQEESIKFLKDKDVQYVFITRDGAITHNLAI